MKHLFYLLIILIFFASCSSTSGIVTSKTEGQKRGHSEVSKNKKNHLVEQLINSASDNLGVNYRSGGTTKKGFDCSGLMYATFKQFDITLPRSSSEMAKVGKKINPDKIQKGDLIFFKTNGQSVINHVGMVIEVLSDEIKFIHSSTSKGVVISSTKQGYYAKSFVQANRIL
ncbi:MAG: C40 family peptidase [Flavobacterium sp.]